MNEHPYRSPGEIEARQPRSRDLPIAPRFRSHIDGDTPEAICFGGALQLEGRPVHIDVAAIGAGIIVCRECGAMWGDTGINP